MKYLKEHPTCDYVVLRSIYTNREKYALMTYKDPFGPIFRKHRDSAMKSGDHLSAALICDCVLWDIEVRKAVDFRREVVVDQFRREYKFPVAELEEILEKMGKVRASVHNRIPLVYSAIFCMALTFFFFEQSFAVMIFHLFFLVDPPKLQSLTL